MNEKGIFFGIWEESVKFVRCLNDEEHWLNYEASVNGKGVPVKIQFASHEL